MKGRKLMASKQPYEERSDLEKIHSQWNKLIGLHERKEWSASIIRAATAAEIAANFVIRAEFSKHSKLGADFVDSMLTWANGLRGKMQHLVLAFPQSKARSEELKELSKLAETINKTRNKVAHSGNFASRKDARDIESKARRFIVAMAAPYAPEFELKQLRIKSSADGDDISS
jgi:hypothetical protein